ncbi:panE [Symbiodinium natans]|uniref:2-dehydropantoate 2-reductase n=1 Tax=Symbiodinium natans TaxID=878477 RepID=A0A812RPW3_9DINO|nr:panE [Symbiodinium natans]
MHVLGAGSMGCLWAAALTRAGTETRLLLRPGSAKLAACQQGKVVLRVDGCRGSKGNETTATTVHAEALTAGQEADVDQVLVVTKAYSAMNALEMLAPRLKREAVIVVLSNGALALHEQIVRATCLSHVRLVLGITTHGVWSRGPFEIVHAGWGQTRFGTLSVKDTESSDWYRSVLQRLETAGLGAVDEGSNIERCLWLKLAANAAINPLTALEEKPNGFILSCLEARAKVSQICSEVAEVAGALQRNSEQDAQVAKLSGLDLEEFVFQTAQETAENRSSMLQDVAAGRLTEIDYLNGWIASKAKELGMGSGLNAHVTALMKEKEAAMSARKARLA